MRVYYSPKALHWLVQGREGTIPDGAMIVKEQYPPPAARYAGARDDQLPKASNWTIMIKDAKGSKDGWFWGEFFDEVPFDDDQPPFRYPWAGFGLYCVRCHATTEKEQTFAALNNIRVQDGSERGGDATALLSGLPSETRRDARGELEAEDRVGEDARPVDRWPAGSATRCRPGRRILLPRLR